MWIVHLCELCMHRFKGCHADRNDGFMNVPLNNLEDFDKDFVPLSGLTRDPVCIDLQSK